jgi:hypothetical protein
MAKATATIIALIALLFAVNFSAGRRAVADDSTTQPTATTDPSTTQPSTDSGFLQVDADALKSAFLNNGYRADAIYCHRPVDVSGIVKGVAVGPEKGPIVALGGDGQDVAVGCIFPADDKPNILDSVKALNAGDHVVVLCQVLDMANGVVRARGIFIDMPAPAK